MFRLKRLGNNMKNIKAFLPKDYLLKSEKRKVQRLWKAEHLILLGCDEHEEYYYLDHDVTIPNGYYGVNSFNLIIAPGVKVTGEIGHVEIIQGVK